MKWETTNRFLHILWQRCICETERYRTAASRLAVAAKKWEWTCIFDSRCKLRKGDTGTEFCFLCSSSHILYSFQQLLFCCCLVWFSIFVLKKLFLKLLLSISYRSLEIKVLQVPNPFVTVRLKWLLNRRIQHKIQWQSWRVKPIPEKDAFKGEKKSSYRCLARIILGCILWPHHQKALK